MSDCGGQGVQVTLLNGPGVIVAGDKLKTYGLMSLDAGQSVSVTEGTAPVKRLTPEEIQVITAWRSDEVIFNGQTLVEVVSEYNRYLKRKIIIQDPALSTLRLGGRFNVRDPKAFFPRPERRLSAFAPRTTVSTLF